MRIWFWGFVAACIAAGGAGAGCVMRDRVAKVEVESVRVDCEKRVTALTKAHEAEKKRWDEERLAMREAARKAVEDAEARGRETSARLARAERAARDAASAIRKETVYVEREVAAVVPPTRLAHGWVRLYDAALRAGGGNAQSSGGTDASAGRAGPADAERSEFNEWDVLRNHQENAERWGECRRQLGALIAFLEGGVVTAHSEQGSDARGSR